MMVGLFPDFYRPSAEGKIKTWLVQVNHLGEAAVYRVDEQGRAAHMVCGKVPDVILLALENACSDYFVEKIVAPDCPWAYGWRDAMWSVVADAIAGRIRHPSRAEYRRIFGRYYGGVVSPLPRYLQLRGDDHWDVVPTAAAMAVDEQLAAALARHAAESGDAESGGLGE